MSERKGSIGDIITGLMITVLFVVILSLVVFAARGYQNAVEIQDANANTRAVSSYILSSVRDNNAGAVIEDRDGMQCLIIAGDGEYEQRFYHYEGALYEEYCEPDQPVRPDVALKIGDTEVFSLEIRDNGVLEIITDEGSAYVNTLRHVTAGRENQ